MDERLSKRQKEDMQILIKVLESMLILKGPDHLVKDALADLAYAIRTGGVREF